MPLKEIHSSHPTEAEVLEQKLSKHSGFQVSFVRQDRMQILFNYRRPKEEVSKDSATTGRKQDPDVSSRH